MTNISTTSDQILASARALIMQGGYNGFSYADIADVVGIRKASIHHHFPSKVDLVRTLLQRYQAETRGGLAAIEQNSENSLQLLKIYAGYWAKCIEDESMPFCVCALLASELPALPNEVAVEVTGFFRILSKWLTGVMERGAKDGTLGLSNEAAIEAEAFMASVHGAMISARAYGKPEIFAAILETNLSRFVRSKRS